MSGVGLDLLEIERLEKALERRPNLARRLFTDGERAYAATRARPGQHLAARFCAKEAVVKALGLEVFRAQEIEVVGGGEAAELRLHGEAAARAGELGVEVRVSLTHTRTTAGVVAVLLLARPCRSGSSHCPTPARCARPTAGPSRSRGSRPWTSWSVRAPGSRAVEDVAPSGLVAVVCGKGNNGGDGSRRAAAARDRPGGAGPGRGRPGRHARRRAGQPRPAAGRSPRAVLGARTTGRRVRRRRPFGTGFAGEAHGVVLEAIERSTRQARGSSRRTCHGVDASSGKVGGAAVRADATATFAAGKPGLWIRPGKEHAGKVRVVDIGIPRGAPVEPTVGLIRDSVLSSDPAAPAGSTKFTSGHVLVAGGSRGLTGAPCLAAGAAMRAGAGYVTACIPGSLEAIFEARLLEAMTLALPDQDGVLTPAGVDLVVGAAQRGGAGRSARVCRRRGTPRASPARLRAGRRSCCCSTPTGSTPTRSAWETWPVAGRRPS